MAFLHRLPAFLLLLTLPACTPKDDADDTGDEGGTTTTGDDGVTTGNSTDPTSPGTVSASSGGSATTAGTTAGTDATASGGSTITSTSGDPTVGTSTSTSGDPTVGTSTSTSGDTTVGTTVGTSTSTSGDPSDTDTPVDPPAPCEGAATPLVGITTQIGYLKSQVPERPDPTVGTSTSGGGELDPGTLFLKLSDQAFTCADPNAPLACGPHWEVTIVIPPEFQSPGVHNLLGQNVLGIASESGPEENNNECSFGGGSFGATFEILSIDDDVVEARLCNVESFFFDTDPQLEGSFTATRCPE